MQDPRGRRAGPARGRRAGPARGRRESDRLEDDVPRRLRHGGSAAAAVDVDPQIPPRAGTALSIVTAIIIVTYYIVWVAFSF